MVVLKTGECLNHWYSVASMLCCMVFIVASGIFSMLNKYKKPGRYALFTVEMICAVTYACIFFFAPRVEYKVVTFEKDMTLYEVQEELDDYTVLGHNFKKNTWRIIEKEQR